MSKTSLRAGIITTMRFFLLLLSATLLFAQANFKEIGSAKAPITVEIYADYECPHCRALYMEVVPSLIAEFVKTGKVRLIHRDFQSQNIMIKNGKPVLLDFQGMREGCLFYDLGSLICDPYVTFDDEERNELINFYYELMNPAYSRDEFVNNFWMGSVQRLLQALGAYGFLGLKKNKPAFLGHIGNGLENLLIAIDNVSGLQLLNDLATECETILARKNY